MCSSASLLALGAERETNADGCHLAALPGLKQEAGWGANTHSSLVPKPGQTDPRKRLGLAAQRQTRGPGYGQADPLSLLSRCLQGAPQVAQCQRICLPKQEMPEMRV